MAATEQRGRRSTLSKIGKIFGVSQVEEPNAKSASSSSSCASSLNSSQVDLTAMNKKSPKKITTILEDNINSSVESLEMKADIQRSTNGQSLSDRIQERNIQGTTTAKPPSRPPSRTPSVRVDPTKSSQLSRASSLNSSADKEKEKVPKNPPRFLIHEDGSHSHHLRNNKRQEKLSKMLRNLLQSTKVRDEAVSAVPELMQSGPPSLFANLVKNYDGDQNNPFSGATRVQLPTGDSPASENISSRLLAPTSKVAISVVPNPTTDKSMTFAERYGKCQETIGRGTFGVVRVSHKRSSEGQESLFAVKEFKRRPSESESKYSRRLTSEFCISSSLKHVNIIETLDLLQDAKGDYVEVMQYCSGGDLYTLIIAAGKLEYMEADCFFKQLIRGVNYMHSMGVAHRDLKPENLLLTDRGVLKITDFGNGECFRMAWEEQVHLSRGICGSSPYIAPEEYTSTEFDPRGVDIWSCGVIYMAMRTGRHLWRTATQNDEFYVKYLEGRKCKEGYEPIEMLKRSRCRNVIYSILDPVPSRRINGKQVLMSEWGREIKCCVECVNKT
jgi:protein-serine/threonine kinase